MKKSVRRIYRILYYDWHIQNYGLQNDRVWYKQDIENSFISFALNLLHQQIMFIHLPQLSDINMPRSINCRGRKFPLDSSSFFIVARCNNLRKFDWYLLFRKKKHTGDWRNDKEKEKKAQGKKIPFLKIIICKILQTFCKTFWMNNNIKENVYILTWHEKSRRL